jgi:hypothetical protein
MIAFDNGPADGDYVRYIEAMAKVAATNAVQAAATPMASTGSNATGFDDPVQARMRQVEVQRARTTPAAAAIARATALQTPNNAAVPPALARGSAFVLAGLALAIVGLFMQPTRPLFLIAGIALFVVGLRQAIKAVNRRTPT